MFRARMPVNCPRAEGLELLGLKILIVEDDTAIAENLYKYLVMQGCNPDVIYDGNAALELLRHNHFDAVVLDIGLPGRDGFRVLQALRCELNRAVPVLMLTARHELEDKLAGFAHGADDYLTKPFALAEVHARILAQVKRVRGTVVEQSLTAGPLVLNLAQRSLSVHGVPVNLTRKTLSILEILIRHSGRVVSREELEGLLWPEGSPSAGALRSQMHLLRQALTQAGFDGIDTIHGTGWRLIDDPLATR